MERTSPTEADEAEQSNESVISRRGAMKAGGAGLLALSGISVASSPAAAHHGIWTLESRGYKGSLKFGGTYHKPFGPFTRPGYIFRGHARGKQRVRVVQETRRGGDGKVSDPFTVSGEWEKRFHSYMSKAYDCFYIETV